MAVRTFAAIDVGSYELTMKIFEISQKLGLREIDCISHRIELGTDTYNTGKISNERVDELCAVLREFKQIMEGYKVDAYKAYGTSAIRETENTLIVLDTIAGRTGIKVDVISNSEQRFLDYKAIASKGEGFRKIIEKGTVIVDIGGGSIQVSLFDKDSLVTTQNIRLGVLRMRDRIRSMAVKPSDYERLIEEMVDNQLEVLKKMYFKDREVSHIIMVDDYLSAVMQKPLICGEKPGFMTSRQCFDFVEAIKGKNRYIFEDALVRNICYQLKTVDGNFTVRKENGRIYVETEGDYDYDETVAALQRVFGIVGICPVLLVEDKGFEALSMRHILTRTLLLR